MYRMVILLFSLLLVVLSPPTVVLAEESPVQPRNDEQVTLEAGLLANGSTLLSIPLDLGSKDVGAWLVEAGLSPKGMHGWDARLQKYVPLKTVQPGQGFLLARGPGKLQVTGQRVTASAVEVVLNKGYNLVGVPYEARLPLGSLRITVDGKTENYPAAVEKKWIGAMTALVDGKLTPLTEPTAYLEPWRGYWLYAYQPCQLTIPDLLPEATAPDLKGKIQNKR